MKCNCHHSRSRTSVPGLYGLTDARDARGGSCDQETPT